MSTASMREAAAKVADDIANQYAGIERKETDPTRKYTSSNVLEFKADTAHRIAAAIRAMPDPAPQPRKEDREVAEQIVEPFDLMPGSRKRLIERITAAIEASRVEERAAVVAKAKALSSHLKAGRGKFSKPFHQKIAAACIDAFVDDIERGDHLTPEKGDG